MDHEMEQPYQLVNSVYIFHRAQFKRTGYPILPIVQFPLLNATANDMPAKTEKSKVLHSFKARFNVLTTKTTK